MQNSVEIQVKGKTFKLGYGLEVFIKLGELWGFDTLEEVNERFQVLNQVQESGRTSLKNMIVMSEIIEGMIKANPENTETITALEIRSLNIQEFEEVFSQFINGFSKAMPQHKNESTEKKMNSRNKSKGL